MLCPKCGKENPDDAHLCQFCKWVMSCKYYPQTVDSKRRKLIITGFIIIVALLSILTPVFFHVRATVHKMICGTNMSLLCMTMLLYAQDYNDKFPTPSKWCDLIIEHTDVKTKMFRCPGAPEGQCNYAMNKNIEKLGTKSPPDMVMLFETKPGWNQFGGPEILSTENHYSEGCNVAFMDTHVDFVKTEDLNKLKWTAE
jgi:prepilin-type processing-associated H-X9-DG protein